MSDFGRSLVGVVWVAPSAAQKQPGGGLTLGAPLLSRWLPRQPASAAF